MKVISPMDGTPAGRAGVKAGDVITAIDGQSASGLTVNERSSSCAAPSAPRSP